MIFLQTLYFCKHDIFANMIFLQTLYFCKHDIFAKYDIFVKNIGFFLAKFTFFAKVYIFAETLDLHEWHDRH
jgi:hypothetical protein